MQLDPQVNDLALLRPHYNDTFEKLGAKATTEVEQYVAYGIYKETKKEWVRAYIGRYGKRPHAEAFGAFSDTLTDTQLDNYIMAAQATIGEYEAMIVREARPVITEEVLRGTLWGDVSRSVLASLAYTVLLIVALLGLKWIGLDVIGLLSK